MQYKILFLVIFMFSPLAKAQEDNVLQDINVDDLGNVTDEFQELFFEALKHKAIENYDRAIQALDKCIELQPEEAILYFEKGKNLARLGKTTEAETAYLKALQLKPNQRSIMESLYEVYHAELDFDKAIDLLKQLTVFDIHYKEDLARVYVRTKEFKKAIDLLNELDQKLGKDAYRNQIRKQIYALSDDNLKEQELLSRIKENPDVEENYLNLIYVYSEQGETQKAYKTAQKLLEINPDSDVVHLALYKFRLESGKVEEAIKSLEIILKSNEINAKAKHSILNDFLIYVGNHPEFESELEQAVSLFSEEEAVDVNEELGAYYLKNKESNKALPYYEDAYKKEPTDFNILKNLMMLRIDARLFNEALSVGDEALSLYPSQPIFYLGLGVAHNNLAQYKKALEILEIGIDYIIDNPKMQADFYNQCAIACEQMGNTSKAANYRKRANALNQ